MSDRERFGRCFITGPSGPLMKRVSLLLAKCGVQAVRAERLLRPNLVSSEEILRQIQSADYFAAIISRSPSPNVSYEMGIARGLGKPILAFTSGSALAHDMRDLYVVRLGKNPDWDAAAADVRILDVRPYSCRHKAPTLKRSTSPLAATTF